MQGDQRHPQSNLQHEFLLSPLERVGQGPEQLQAFAQVIDRFHMSRLLNRPFACFLPIPNRLGRQTCLGVVIG